MDIDAFNSLEPISSLTPEFLDELIDKTETQSFDKETILFQEGIPENTAVYLLKGKLLIRKPGKEKKFILEAGSTPAADPLNKLIDQNLSLISLDTVEIALVDRELLDTLLTWGQFSSSEVEVIMSERGIITIDRSAWLKLMLKSSAFRKLPTTNIEELLNRLEPITVHSGDMIIKQGDPGDYYYMISEGTVLVSRNPEGEEDSVELAQLSAGDSFGEASLISDIPRSASIRMMTPGVLLRLSKEDFNRLLKQPTLHWLNYDQAKAKIDAGAKWIDVRLDTEFKQGHLADALSIPMRSLHKQARLLDKSIEYICYCQTGRRSSAATFILNNYNLKTHVLQYGLEKVPPKSITK